jgi:hypothetical protein
VVSAVAFAERGFPSSMAISPNRSRGCKSPRMTFLSARSGQRRQHAAPRIADARDGLADAETARHGLTDKLTPTVSSMCANRGDCSNTLRP